MEYRGVRKNRAQVRALEERYARESLSYVFEFYNGFIYVFAGKKDNLVI